MGNTKSQEEKNEYQGGCFYEALEIKDCYLGRYSILKNSLRPDHLYLSKQLNPVQYDSFQADVEEFSFRLTKSYRGFCDFHFIDPNPFDPDVYDMIFEFGNYLTVLQTEQSLWNFINDLTAALKSLEADGIHYPVIRKKYACYSPIHKCFKLLNPFCFGAFNEDLLRIYLNPNVNDNDKLLFLKAKVNKSVREFGITILALSSGLEEAHFVQNPGLIKGKLDSMEATYSEKLTQFLRFLIETRGELTFADVRIFFENGSHPLFRNIPKRTTISERNFPPQYSTQDQWGSNGRTTSLSGFPQVDPRNFYSLNNMNGNGYPLNAQNYQNQFDHSEPQSFRNNPNLAPAQNYNSNPYQGQHYQHGFPPNLNNTSVNHGFNSNANTWDSERGNQNLPSQRPVPYQPNLAHNGYPSNGNKPMLNSKNQDTITNNFNPLKPLDQYIDFYNQSTSMPSSQNNNNNQVHEKKQNENPLSNLDNYKKQTPRQEISKEEFTITNSEIIAYSKSKSEEENMASPIVPQNIQKRVTESKDSNTNPLKLVVPNNTPRTTIDNTEVANRIIAADPFVNKEIPDMFSKRNDEKVAQSTPINEPSSPAFPKFEDKIAEKKDVEVVEKIETSKKTSFIDVEEEKKPATNPNGLKVTKVRMKWLSEKNCHVEVVEYEDGSTEERPPRDQEMLKKIMENFLRKKEEEKTNEVPQHIPKKSAMHQYDVSTLTQKSDEKIVQDIDSFSIRLFSPDPDANSRLIYTSEIKELFDSFNEMMRIVDLRHDLRPSMYHNVEVDYFGTEIISSKFKADLKTDEDKEVKFEIRSLETHPFSAAGKNE
jgi:hypothetical protein